MYVCVCMFVSVWMCVSLSLCVTVYAGVSEQGGPGGPCPPNVRRGARVLFGLPKI